MALLYTSWHTPHCVVASKQWLDLLSMLMALCQQSPFPISHRPKDYGVDLAVFLTPTGSEIPPNLGGGFLGLFNTTTNDSSGNQVFLVDFDTYPNPKWDYAIELMGININFISSVEYAP
ncbi:L-type lectin-domain containing receptor kinase IX.1-like [Gossypium hirsutum]|uniref:L-type lectin-domain containing receptor kinase IX.1-like n=1 Tax=Gossypium hirsutum TaxID=3635 RepID=A0A1U8PL39_GOSHI|nr:L-type lectin-domain containing receptor kinase IX.1-like [Gossypium hirsutum]